MGNIASLGGMYGADAGATYKTAQLGGAVGAPSTGMGAASDASLTPGTLTATATPITTYNILPAAIGNAGLLGNTVAWWFGVILLIIALKWAAEHNAEGKDYGTIRVGLYNILVITLAGIIGNTALKMLLSKYRFAGLSDLVLGA